MDKFSDINLEEARLLLEIRELEELNRKHRNNLWETASRIPETQFIMEDIDRNEKLLNMLKAKLNK